jgi:hypothetical protein
MLESRTTMRPTGPVHDGFKDPRRPILRGDPRNFAMAKADQCAFTAEVVRFGFYPTDSALDIVRFAGKRSAHARAATFAMTVGSLHTGRCAPYLGRPGHAWVTEFVLDLIAGTFGRP